MTYDPRILTALDPDWASRLITVVTFPAPPTIAKGVVYAEDAWRSDALDRAWDIFDHQGATVLAAAFTDRGPAFVQQMPLSKLFTVDTFATPNGIYCATISYKTLIESNQVTYATDIVLENVMSIYKSCHPGSHTSVPLGPYLTLFLQLSRALDGREVSEGFTYADHRVAGKYFPAIDFSGNVVVDALFRFASVSDVLGSKTKSIRLPSVISQALRDVVISSLVANDNLTQQYPDPVKRIEVITRFESQLRHQEAV